MTNRKIFYTTWLIIVLLTLTGCAGRTPTESFIREDVDIGFVERIGVLPFQNNSADKYMPVLARNITVTQVLAMGLFDVVDKELVDNMLYNEAIETGVPLDPLTLKRIGGRLNVQALLLGTVDMAGTGKVGSATYPEVALTLRLVEADTGLILWQASGSYTGESLGRRLLGVKNDNLYEINFNLIRKLLRTAPMP